ncbi:MAG: YitT family protein [Fretibacterium sp.]|nr:YitT family protein [Fretibacterium sp.]
MASTWRDWITNKIASLQARRAAFHDVFRNELGTFWNTTLGTILTCFAIVALIMPYRFSSGGVTGIALITNYLWGISPAWVLSVGNALLLLWGWRYLSLRFALWTLYVSALTSLVIPLLELIPYPTISEPMLASLLGGVVGGLGYGMLFRVDASSGGMDVVAMAAKKRWGVDVGIMSLYLNLFIHIASIAIVSLEQVLFGVMLLYVESLTVDGVVRSFHRRTQALVISNHASEVADFILSELGHTATLIPARGAYRGVSIELLLVVLPRRQVPSLKRRIAALDPAAFVIFSDVSEVVGEGFKSWIRA